MTKKEVLEIRKQFTITNCTISKICGCYVDEEKQIILKFNNPFLSLPEEQEFKYLDIFQKVLSGKLNKNLLNVTYRTEEEVPDSAHSLLMDLTKSRLADDALLEEFYEKILESYAYTGRYLILLVHGGYDVPGKASEGSIMEDASEQVYEHILCGICPVDLSDAGLCVNMEDTSVEARIRDWIVKLPMHGFLFPAFNDRASDIHGALFYTKKDTDLQEIFTHNVLGSENVTSGSVQKDFFKETLTDALHNTSGYKVMQEIQATVRDKIEETDDAVPAFSRKDCMDILSGAGISDEMLAQTGEAFDQSFGEKGHVLADSLTEITKTTIEVGALKISVPEEMERQMEVVEVNGRKCIAIFPDGPITVNGVETHI